MAKILLVDDDSVLLRLYSTKFVNEGHEVKTALNGQEALDIVKTYIPDVMVLDLLMPKLNGFTFIEMVRTDARLRQVPIIVFSSVVNDEQIARLKTMGISDYLNKTDTTPTQLVQLINQKLTS